MKKAISLLVAVMMLLAITIPADFASGDDTLIVVIDILGTEPRSSSDLESAPGEAAQSK